VGTGLRIAKNYFRKTAHDAPFDRFRERRMSGVHAFIRTTEQMFSGQHRHSVDAKGRLTIPANYRELLAAGSAYITMGFDRNLLVMPEPAYEKTYASLVQNTMTDSTARLLRRLIIGNAAHVEWDKMGRILIPHHLREAIELNSEAVIVGIGDSFEIWAPQHWAVQEAKLFDAETNEHRFRALNLSM
jgi:MraZ protein